MPETSKAALQKRVSKACEHHRCNGADHSMSYVDAPAFTGLDWASCAAQGASRSRHRACLGAPHLLHLHAMHRTGTLCPWPAELLLLPMPVHTVPQ